MEGVIVGGAISLVASLITTFLVARMAYRHELRTRWDRDTLTTVSKALVAAERAMGRIYAWSRGDNEPMDGRSRPKSVDGALDIAYYELQELSVLFPGISAPADEIQRTLVQLADLTRTVAKTHHPAATSERYLAESDAKRATIMQDIAHIRSAAQNRLKIGDQPRWWQRHKPATLSRPDIEATTPPPGG